MGEGGGVHHLWFLFVSTSELNTFQARKTVTKLYWYWYIEFFYIVLVKHKIVLDLGEGIYEEMGSVTSYLHYSGMRGGIWQSDVIGETEG